jgi:hypothetical protein
MPMHGGLVHAHTDVGTEEFHLLFGGGVTVGAL